MKKTRLIYLIFLSITAPLFGCDDDVSKRERDKKSPKDGSDKITLISHLTSTHKNSLDLVKKNDKLFVLKRPAKTEDLASFLKQAQTHFSLVHLFNNFNFCVGVEEILSDGPWQGVLLEYLPVEEWVTIKELTLSEDQLKDLMNQVVLSMMKYRELKLDSCVLHVDNVLINRKTRTIKLVDRDDGACMMRFSSAEETDKLNIAAFKAIFSVENITKRNPSLRDFLQGISLLATRDRSFDKIQTRLSDSKIHPAVNELSEALKEKIEKERIKILSSMPKKSSSKEIAFEKVVAFLDQKGLTEYDRGGLQADYVGMIKYAREKPASDREEFLYSLSHNVRPEEEPPFHYEREAVFTTRQKRLFESWLAAFKEIGQWPEYKDAK